MNACRALAALASIAVVVAASGCRESTTQTNAIVPASTTAQAAVPEAGAAPTIATPPAATTAPSASAPTPATTTPPPPAMAAKIKSTFGDRCRFERACGGLWGIDCDAAVDGPYYYVKADTLEKVAACGGVCMGGRCTNCPPKEWTCATY